jgi:N-acetylglucosamine kinase-like BadF-type ATPase
MSWALGVDGGNSKTLAVVAGSNGRPRGIGKAGPSDIHNAPPPVALKQLELAVAAALADAGIEGDAIQAAAFSLAGADYPEDFALLEEYLPGRLGIARGPLVVNDAIGALRAGAPDWVGISVVSGTYNAVGARRPDGRVFHHGFWPDGIGGRDLGRQAINAIYRADLGLGPATALTERALELFEVPDVPALLYAFTRRGGLPESEADRLAVPLLDLADAGDPVAHAIVSADGRMLGRQARVSAERLELPIEGTRVVLAGSVFAQPTALLADSVMAELPGAVPVRHGPPPVAGPVLLALDRLGVDVSGEAVRDGLRAIVAGKGIAWAGSGSTT